MGIISNGGGAMPVTTDSSGNSAGRVVVADGDTPIQEIYADSIISFTSTATAIGTTTDISMYRGVVLTFVGNGDTLAITGYYDAAETLESDAIHVTEMDGTFLVASALPDGTYYFNNPYRKLKFVASGAVNSCVITGAVMAQPIV